MANSDARPTSENAFLPHTALRWKFGRRCIECVHCEESKAYPINTCEAYLHLRTAKARCTQRRGTWTQDGRTREGHQKRGPNGTSQPEGYTRSTPKPKPRGAGLAKVVSVDDKWSTHTHTHCCCSVHRSTTNFPRRPRGARRSRPPSLGATQRRAGLPARGNHPAPGHRSGLCNATLLPSGRSPGNWQPRLEPTPECPRAKHIPRGDLTGPSTLTGASCHCTTLARPCQFRVPSGRDRKGGTHTHTHTHTPTHPHTHTPTHPHTHTPTHKRTHAYTQVNDPKQRLPA